MLRTATGDRWPSASVAYCRGSGPVAGSLLPWACLRWTGRPSAVGPGPPRLVTAGFRGPFREIVASTQEASMVPNRRVAAAALSLLALPLSAATFTVTTNADAGAGSLRQAITDANGAAGADTIAFAIPGTGPHTIALASALPADHSAPDDRRIHAVGLFGEYEPGRPGAQHRSHDRGRRHHGRRQPVRSNPGQRRDHQGTRRRTAVAARTSRSWPAPIRTPGSRATSSERTSPARWSTIRASARTSRSWVRAEASSAARRRRPATCSRAAKSASTRRAPDPDT